MTDSAGTRLTPPGWYADPAGSAQSRWWDGTQWTDHLHDPSLAAYQVAAAPVIGPQTPVYNFIWAISLLPLVSILSFLPFDFTGYILRSTYGTPAILEPTYLLVTLLGWVVYLGTALLAFFDWRRLTRDGFERPFHWAWAFLANGVYVIGRSIIVKRRAGRGLAPIWAFAALTIVYVIVVLAKMVDAISAVMSTVPFY